VPSETSGRPAFDRRIGKRLTLDEPVAGTWLPATPPRARQRPVVVRLLDISVTGALLAAGRSKDLDGGRRGELRFGQHRGQVVVRRIEEAAGAGTYLCRVEFLDRGLAELAYLLAARQGEGTAPDEDDGARLHGPPAPPSETRTPARPSNAAAARPLRRRDLLA
jgi:hypothetical protein